MNMFSLRVYFLRACTALCFWGGASYADKTSNSQKLYLDYEEAYFQKNYSDFESLTTEDFKFSVKIYFDGELYQNEIWSRKELEKIWRDNETLRRFERISVGESEVVGLSDGRFCFDYEVDRVSAEAINYEEGAITKEIFSQSVCIRAVGNRYFVYRHSMQFTYR